MSTVIWMTARRHWQRSRQEARKGSRSGSSETLPGTVRRMAAEAAGAEADSEAARLCGLKGRPADGYVWSLKSRENWRNAGRLGPPA